MIIACDLDGTLTNRAGIISARNAGALRWAAGRGAACVLATSRPSRCLDLPPSQVALFACVVTCDGAEWSGHRPAEVRAPLSRGDVSLISGKISDAGVPGFYAVEFGAAMHYERGFSGWPATDTGARVGSRPLHDLCAHGPVARLYFRPENPRDGGGLAAAKHAVSGCDGISCTTVEQPAEVGLLQFSSEKATKGDALRTWLDETGLRDQRLVVFGDHLNDLSMLELGDEAFAVGNAHPAVFRRYRHLRNDDESAIARWILSSSSCSWRIRAAPPVNDLSGLSQTRSTSSASAMPAGRPLLPISHRRQRLSSAKVTSLALVRIGQGPCLYPPGVGAAAGFRPAVALDVPWRARDGP